MGLGRLIKFNGSLMLLNIGKSYFYNFSRPVSVSIRYGYAGCLLRS